MSCGSLATACVPPLRSTLRTSIRPRSMQLLIPALEVLKGHGVSTHVSWEDLWLALGHEHLLGAPPLRAGGTGRRGVADAGRGGKDGFSGVTRRGASEKGMEGAH